MERFRDRKFRTLVKSPGPGILGEIGNINPPAPGTPAFKILTPDRGSLRAHSKATLPNGKWQRHLPINAIQKLAISENCERIESYEKFLLKSVKVKISQKVPIIRILL